jgi:hypothetical protein
MTATERVLKSISERWENAGLRWLVAGQLPNEKAGSRRVLTLGQMDVFLRWFGPLFLALSRPAINLSPI